MKKLRYAIYKKRRKKGAGYGYWILDG